MGALSNEIILNVTVEFTCASVIYLQGFMIRSAQIQDKMRTMGKENANRSQEYEVGSRYNQEVVKPSGVFPSVSPEASAMVPLSPKPIKNNGSGFDYLMDDDDENDENIINFTLHKIITKHCHTAAVILKVRARIW